MEAESAQPINFSIFGGNDIFFKLEFEKASGSISSTSESLGNSIDMIFLLFRNERVRILVIIYSWLLYVIDHGIIRFSDT